MSAARSYQKQLITSATMPPPKKRKRFLGILAIILGVGILALGAISTINKDKIPEEYADQANSMAQHLQDKYGQEFAVENVKLTGTGLGTRGSWRATAHPKSDPSLKFQIRRNQTTNEIDYETFLQTLWTKDGSQEVETFLNKEFPRREYSSLRISPGNSPRSPLYRLVKGKTLSLSDALKNHKDAIFYELVIHDVVLTASEEPSNVSLERAMKVANFVKAKGVGAASVYYAYRDASFIDKNKSGEQKYQYRIKLEREALQMTNSPNDLKQHFEVIKY